jgi:hypothetical protein
LAAAVELRILTRQRLAIDRDAGIAVNGHFTLPYLKETFD